MQWTYAGKDDYVARKMSWCCWMNDSRIDEGEVKDLGPGREVPTEGQEWVRSEIRFETWSNEAFINEKLALLGKFEGYHDDAFDELVSERHHEKKSLKELFRQRDELNQPKIAAERQLFLC